MNKTTTATLSLLLIVFVWGATFVVVQDAIAFLAPFSFNAIRFFIALLALLAYYTVVFRKKPPIFTSSIWPSGFALGIWLFLGYAFQTVGLLYTTPAKAGFITGLSVVLVPVFSYFLYRNRLERNTVIGVGLATAGLYMITLLQPSSFGIGDFYVLLCAVSFGLHIIVTGKYARLHHPVPLTIIQIGTVSFLSLFASFLFEDTGRMYRISVLIQQEVLYALLITSLLATALAFLGQTHFQTYTTATRVALIFAMEPVFAALTSYFVTGESFTFSMIVGCFFILSGIILAELSPRAVLAFKRGRRKRID
ncbi:MAG: DMT family transporter [Bacillus sp. (in: firmicutes)]